MFYKYAKPMVGTMHNKRMWKKKQNNNTEFNIEYGIYCGVFKCDIIKLNCPFSPLG